MDTERGRKEREGERGEREVGFYAPMGCIIYRRLRARARERERERQPEIERGGRECVSV